MCGLKLSNKDDEDEENEVAPFAGVWIEIGTTVPIPCISCGRTLRGCVD